MPEDGVHREHRAGGPLRAGEAAEVAELMGALSNPSRLLVLHALRREGELSVGALAEAAGVAPSAVSQQLRVLRHLRLVVSRKEGRSSVYALHDTHVASLLDEILDHAEHARLGWSSPPYERRGAAKTGEAG